jgi:SAM-dependent methyltransferase
MRASRGTTYAWPPLNGVSQPHWCGDGFLVDGRRVSVLTYSGGESGWSAGLTNLHENFAGDDHPIDELSRGWAASRLRRHLATPDATLIEVGCSSGFMLTRLSAGWPSALVMGSDFLREPLEALASRSPEIPLLQFDLVQCPLPGDSVDAVVALNVLEHIKDHETAMAQIARILRPGGIAVIEVPAGPHLYDMYDEHLRHERRYTADGLATLIEGSGLKMIERSHLGWTVYPGFARVKRRHQKQGAVSAEARRTIVEQSIERTRSGTLLRFVLQVEAWLGRYVSYPIGIRCVAVARKGVSA